MKKGPIIVALIIAITLASFAGIFYKLQDLEFAGTGINQVTASGVNLTILVCNPSFLPQSIEQMQAVLYSQSNNIGILDVAGKTVSPHSQAILDGTMAFQDLDSMKNFIGWVVNGQNPSDFQATMTVKTKYWT